MQLAITIALAVFYVGISLMLGGVHPKSGMPWWFFAPTAVAFLASFVAITIMGKLPLPWDDKERYSLPPRSVHRRLLASRLGTVAACSVALPLYSANAL